MTDEQILAEARFHFDVDAIGWTQVLIFARALLSASKPAVPMGWKLVPVELTGEMCRVLNEREQVMVQPTWAQTYRAMLAASPAAPAQSHLTSSATESNDRQIDAAGKAGEAVAYTSAERLAKIAKNPAHVDTLWGPKLVIEGEGDIPLYAVPPSQHAEGGETCKCRRLGDWKGFHHPLCDEARAPSAVVLDDERAAFEAAWSRVYDTGDFLLRHHTLTEQYANHDTQRAWEGWKLARAASPQPAQTERALTGWQPIATAPTDGTPLILFARSKRATASIVVVGWYMPHHGWIETAFADNEPVGIVPSHWMPRPSFPSGGDKA